MTLPDNKGDPYRRLCAAVIKCAWEDAQGRSVHDADQAWGLAWLASRRASEFFGELNFTQSQWLMASDWRELARKVLAAPPEDASPAHLGVIEESLAHLDALAADRAARHDV